MHVVPSEGENDQNTGTDPETLQHNAEVLKQLEEQGVPHGKNGSAPEQPQMTLNQMKAKLKDEISAMRIQNAHQAEATKQNIIELIKRETLVAGNKTQQVADLSKRQLELRSKDVERQEQEEIQGRIDVLNDEIQECITVAADAYQKVTS